MKKHGLAIALILMAAVAVYGVRSNWFGGNGDICADLCQRDDQTFEINAAAFKRTVADPLESARLFNLIVFVDPDRECQACLFETEMWLTPLSESPEYAVHFFIPEEAPETRVTGYLDAFGLTSDQITRFDQQDPLAAYYRYGLVKVLYNLEDGIIWLDGGNQGESEQQQFLERLRNTLGL